MNVDANANAAISSRSNLLFRALLFMTVMAALGSVIATEVHLHQVRHSPLDLIIPPIMAVSFSLVAVYLYRNPLQYRRAALAVYLLGLIALAAPAWYYPLIAIRTETPLIEILPPIAAALFPLLLSITVFLRPSRPLLASALTWLAIAPPILVYLLLHPSEMLSPRGHDLTMTLGPVMLIVVVYTSVHRRIDALAESLHAQQAELKALAERDGLTNLLNRRALELRWSKLAANTPRGLVLFDVDYFKRVNDQFGHAAGDDVLREIASRCSKLLRAGDYLARWGGEEFLAITSISDLPALLDFADRLRNAIGGVSMPGVGEVTISAGATMAVEYESLAAGVQRADLALYRAKANGRNRVDCA